MNRLLTRIVAFLLVPCLIADPVMAVGIRQFHLQNPRTIPSIASTLFSTQALSQLLLSNPGIKMGKQPGRDNNSFWAIIRRTCSSLSDRILPAAKTSSPLAEPDRRQALITMMTLFAHTAAGGFSPNALALGVKSLAGEALKSGIPTEPFTAAGSVMHLLAIATETIQRYVANPASVKSLQQNQIAAEVSEAISKWEALQEGNQEDSVMQALEKLVKGQLANYRQTLDLLATSLSENDGDAREWVASWRTIAEEEGLCGPRWELKLLVDGLRRAGIPLDMEEAYSQVKETLDSSTGEDERLVFLRNHQIHFSGPWLLKVVLPMVRDELARRFPSAEAHGISLEELTQQAFERFISELKRKIAFTYAGESHFGPTLEEEVYQGLSAHLHNTIEYPMGRRLLGLGVPYDSDSSSVNRWIENPDSYPESRLRETLLEHYQRAISRLIRDGDRQRVLSKIDELPADQLEQNARQPGRLVRKLQRDTRSVANESRRELLKSMAQEMAQAVEEKGSTVTVFMTADGGLVRLNWRSFNGQRIWLEREKLVPLSQAWWPESGKVKGGLKALDGESVIRYALWIPQGTSKEIIAKRLYYGPPSREWHRLGITGPTVGFSLPAASPPAADRLSFKYYSELSDSEKTIPAFIQLLRDFNPSFGSNSWDAYFCKHRDALIAFVDGLPSGIYAFSVEPKTGKLFGERIHVSADLRRNHIGFALRERLLQLLQTKGYKTFRTGHVESDNEAANGFLEQLRGRPGVEIRGAGIQWAIIQLPEFRPLRVELKEIPSAAAAPRTPPDLSGQMEISKSLTKATALSGAAVETVRVARRVVLWLDRDLLSLTYYWGEDLVTVFPLIAAVLRMGERLEELLIVAASLEVAARMDPRVVALHPNAIFPWKDHVFDVALSLSEMPSKIQAHHHIHIPFQELWNKEWSHFENGETYSQLVHDNLLRLGFPVSPLGAALIPRTPKEENLIFVNPHSRTNQSYFPYIHATWVRLIVSLLQDGYQVDLNGGLHQDKMNSKQIEKEVRQQVGDRTSFRIAELSREALVEEMAQAVGVVTIDTAIFHLACLFGIPTVVVATSLSGLYVGNPLPNQNYGIVTYDQIFDDAAGSLQKMREMLFELIQRDSSTQNGLEPDTVKPAGGRSPAAEKSSPHGQVVDKRPLRAA